MAERKILLSSGSTPWLGIEGSSVLSKERGFDGYELVPFRWGVKTIKDAVRQHGSLWHKHVPGAKDIQSCHRSWVLDAPSAENSSPIDKSIRILCFPKVEESRNALTHVSKDLNVPVTVHDIKHEWINGSDNQPFHGGVYLELTPHIRFNPDFIPLFLSDSKRGLILDTRDDQSLKWTHALGVDDWKSLWNHLGSESLSKIKAVHLTCMGKSTLTDIINKKETLAEQQLLWLNNQNWSGHLVAEINPISLATVTQGKIGSGLNKIAQFARTTLEEGKSWSD